MNLKIRPFSRPETATACVSKMLKLVNAKGEQPRAKCGKY